MAEVQQVAKSWGPVVLASGVLRGRSFRDRVSAAASSGFTDLGLSVREYTRLRDGGCTDAKMLRILNEFGCRVIELEAHVGLGATTDESSVGATHERGSTSRATEGVLFHMADLFGARHLQAIGAFTDDDLGVDAVDAFGALCDRAAVHDLLVSLEFMPTTNVPDAGVAAQLVTAADRSNGGVCVDSWHHFRGAADPDLLRALPPDRVVLVQIDDGALLPADHDYLRDTRERRCWPLEGEFDLIGMLTVLFEIGVRAPISLEVLSSDLDAEPATSVARAAASAVGRLLRRLEPVGLTVPRSDS